MSALKDHLKTGATTVCRAWDVTRRDGTVLAFTDHDRDLVLDDVTYRANAALSAAEVEAQFGLAADNGAVSGALQSAAITQSDIRAGLFDDADVRAWLVNWANPEEREVTFAGFIGTIEITDGRFSAELRSYAERLNQPLGRRYLRSCDVELGSALCGVDTANPAFHCEAEVKEPNLPRLTVIPDGSYADGWFAHGVLRVDGRSYRITEDAPHGIHRRITVPDLSGVTIAMGAKVVLVAGCSKSSETCRTKFNNILNFQGFPFIPGEDSALATPKAGGGN